MPAVLTGLDTLETTACDSLRGLRLGLVCNHTAITRRREHLLDLALRHELQVKAIFSPEHGFQGRLDEPVASGTHEPTGLPIHSLFGLQQRPSPELLARLDALVYDIADIGVRFYTYTATMTHCLAAAAEAGLRFIVLDRPNPIRGDIAEGPILNPPFQGLSAWHPLPLRHSLTSGELARWANATYEFGADLEIITCRGWRRDMWFHETGLPWGNLSPNIRNPRQALLYVAIGTLEACNISVGRGTETPFEVIGAPWMDELVLADALTEPAIPELDFVPCSFTPTCREFAGELCRGVFILLRDWNRFKPVTAAVRIALVIERLWSEHFGSGRMRHLLGHEGAVEAVAALRPAEEIVALWREELERYRAAIGEHWLY